MMQNSLSIRQDHQVKPPARRKTLGVRISESEYTELERKAWQSGKSLADWAREVLLEGSDCNDSESLLANIFTEQVAVQLLLMNALEPLLRGEKLSREQTAQIFREVQATKATRAQHLLLKRTQRKEK